MKQESMVFRFWFLDFHSTAVELCSSNAIDDHIHDSLCRHQLLVCELSTMDSLFPLKLDWVDFMGFGGNIKSVVDSHMGKGLLQRWVINPLSPQRFWSLEAFKENLQELYCLLREVNGGTVISLWGTNPSFFFPWDTKTYKCVHRPSNIILSHTSKSCSQMHLCM